MAIKRPFLASLIAAMTVKKVIQVYCASCRFMGKFCGLCHHPTTFCVCFVEHFNGAGVSLARSQPVVGPEGRAVRLVGCTQLKSPDQARTIIFVILNCCLFRKEWITNGRDLAVIRVTILISLIRVYLQPGWLGHEPLHESILLFPHGPCLFELTPDSVYRSTDWILRLDFFCNWFSILVCLT